MVELCSSLPWCVAEFSIDTLLGLILTNPGSVSPNPGKPFKPDFRFWCFVWSGTSCLTAPVIFHYYIIATSYTAVICLYVSSANKNIKILTYELPNPNNPRRNIAQQIQPRTRPKKTLTFTDHALLQIWFILSS